MTYSTALIGSLISACLPTWIITHKRLVVRLKWWKLCCCRLFRPVASTPPLLVLRATRLPLMAHCVVLWWACAEWRLPLSLWEGHWRRILLRQEQRSVALEEDMLFMHGLHQVTCCPSFQIRCWGQPPCVYIDITASPRLSHRGLLD